MVQCALFILMFLPWSFADAQTPDPQQLIAEAAQLSDQREAALLFGEPADLDQVLENFRDFDRRAAGIMPESARLNHEWMETELLDFRNTLQVLRSCIPTRSGAAERIVQVLRTIPSPSDVPTGDDTAYVNLIQERIAGEALLKVLKTALVLGQTYFVYAGTTERNIKPAEIRLLVDELCPHENSFCSPRFQNWLMDQGLAFVQRSEFRAIRPRTAQMVSEHLSREFAELNYRFVLSSNERAAVNPWFEGKERQEAAYQNVLKLYQENPKSRAYRDSRTKSKELEAYFTAYAPFSPSEPTIDYTENGTNYGLRNACFPWRGVSGSPADPDGFYAKYQKAYVRISSGMDGTLLFTKILEKNRLQVDGWIHTSKNCPDEYPVVFSEGSILMAEHQAYDDNKAAAKFILKRLEKFKSAKSTADLSLLYQEEGAKWVRGFQPAVAAALKGHAEDAATVCKMVEGLFGKENEEDFIKGLTIAGAVVATGASLFVPVVGSAGVAAVLSATAVTGGVMMIAGDGAGFFENRETQELMVSSIITGNSDLQEHLDEQEIRNEVGQAYRALVIDAGLSGLVAAGFLRQIPLKQLKKFPKKITGKILDESIGMYMKRSNKGFDRNLYLAAMKKAESVPVGIAEAGSPEERAAWYVSQIKKASPETKINEDVITGRKFWKKMKLFNRLENRPGGYTTSSSDVDQIIDLLALPEEPVKLTGADLFSKANREAKATAALQKKFKVDVIKYGVRKAMSDQKMLVPDSKFVTWAQKPLQSDPGRLLVTTALNGLTEHVGIAIVPPQQWVRFSERLLDAAWTKGEDGVFPIIEERLHGRMSQKLIHDLAREWTVKIGVISSSLVMAGYEVQSQTSKEDSSLNAIDTQINETETFLDLPAEAQLLKIWKDGWEKENGRPLNMNSADSIQYLEARKIFYQK